eukprot:COSAG01_NODE_3918_length_5538_cov_28.353374_3_plen_81_part_00
MRTGKTIMMESQSVELMCRQMKSGARVLEWGSGGSTLFFSKYVAAWDTIEHDPTWAQEMVRPCCIGTAFPTPLYLHANLG